MAEADVVELHPKAKEALAYTRRNLELCNDLRQRYDNLKGSTERANCEHQWQEIGEVISPRKVDFVGMRTPGEKKMNKVYDPTGIQANEMLAAGLHGLATNPASQWFSLRMVSQRIVDESEDGEEKDINEADAVKKYLAHTEEVMWQRIYQPGSNFTTAIHEFYLDLGAFGTAILFVGQRDNGGLLFECRSLAECVIAENADGRVDAVFRKCTYTVRQLMRMAKNDGWLVSDHVKDLNKAKKFDEKIDVIHAVFPREERDPGAKGSLDMPYASIYFEHKDCNLLQESGFPEFPYLVARWSKYASEVYGHCPGMMALPDVKMLQAMTIAKIKLLQKNADPVTWLKDDGVVGPSRSVPGGINYIRGNPSEGVFIQPTNMQGYKAIVEDIEMVRQQILRHFFADLMRMVDRADMTATEVVQRTAEQMRLLGPLVGRLESEVLGPLVERVFGILNRMNLIQPAPKEIQGQDFTVEYVSPIATAQKQQSANSVMQVIQMLAVFGPEIAAQIVQQELDVSKLFRWMWDLFNNNPNLLKSKEALEEQASEQQAQKMLAAGQPAMDMLQKGSQAVKNVADAVRPGSNDSGIDLQALISRFQSEVGRNPRAQKELASMAQGEMPDPATMSEMMQ